MLPYQSLQQAETALGRELTLAEKLWFNYSASKPDYILHYHNILFLLVFYSILPLPYVFLELSRSRKILDSYKIQSNVKRSFRDMLKCYKDVMQSFVLTVGPLQIVSYPFVKVWLIIYGDVGRLVLPRYGFRFLFLFEILLDFPIHSLVSGQDVDHLFAGIALSRPFFTYDNKNSSPQIRGVHPPLWNDIFRLIQFVYFLFILVQLFFLIFNFLFNK